jgi:hypothetical protein
MAANSGYNRAELDRLIEAAGERPNNDAKAPLAWDGKTSSASLTKDILALANTQDGGALVIGKSEKDGQFSWDGVTPEQATSFDTTNVARFVNNYCDPPVAPTVYKHEWNGKLYVIIAVPEFTEIPVICTKGFNDPTTGKPILKEGAIYVRTSNTASEPLQKSNHVRTLIGLATRKQGDHLIAAFEAIMKGRPLVPSAPLDDPFVAELAAVEADLNEDLRTAMKSGGWRFAFRPVRHVGELVRTNEELRLVIEKHTVQVRGPYPPTARYDGPQHDWGFGVGHHAAFFGMTRTGLFIAYQPYWEDTKLLPDLQGNRTIRWVGYRQSIFVLTEFFQFLSRFATEFEPGTELKYEVSASALRGRIMSDRSFHVFFVDSDPAVTDTFTRSGIVSVETLRSNWMELCAKIATDFIHLFTGSVISEGVVMNHVQKFVDRRYDE